jgi:hypothetical protein
MMPTVLSWLTTGIAVVGFLAAATVYLRGARDKGTIETLQRNNQALLERVDIQADKILELERSGVSATRRSRRSSRPSRCCRTPPTRVS